MKRFATARSVLGALLVVCALGAVGVPSPSPTRAAAPSTIHVSPSGSDAASGSETSPVRTLARAVAKAASGSSIVLHSGTYHESVQIYAKRVSISAAPGDIVVFDGARTVNGWTHSGNGWYSAGWKASFPRTSGLPVRSSAPMAGYPDLAFRDGSSLRQVARIEDLGSGTFFVDDAADRLWVGDDPSGALIEASDLGYAIWFNKADGSSLAGVTVRRYATPARDMAAVRLYANNLTMSDCKVARNAFKGVSAIGNSITMLRLVVRDNGYIGVHGHLSRRLSLLRSTVVGNNTEGFDAAHSASGVKFTESSIIAVRNSYVADNGGVGIWTDIGTSRVSITGNLVERNANSGVLAELSGRVVIADNVVRSNGDAGVWVLETNDTDVWHNALYGNDRDIWVEDGPRTDPTTNPEVDWDVNHVRIRNNAMGGGRSGVQATLNVDDWTEQRSATDMDVTSDYNAFWLPPTTSTKIARWARWPLPLAINGTLEAHRLITRQDRNSVASKSTTNDFARDAARGDLRTPSGFALGEGANDAVAAAMGIEPGTRLPIGPRRWLVAPGTDQPGVAAR